MPLREYRCTVCGGKIEVIEAGDGFVLHTLEWCGCEEDGVMAEEIVCAPSIRFKGPGFHVNDYGRGPGFTHSSRAKTRYRQEIREAQERGELDDPVLPAEKSNVEDLYGKGSRKPIAKAIKSMGDKDRCEVSLPNNTKVKIRRKERGSFGLSHPT